MWHFVLIQERTCCKRPPNVSTNGADPFARYVSKTTSVPGALVDGNLVPTMCSVAN